MPKPMVVAVSLLSALLIAVFPMTVQSSSGTAVSSGMTLSTNEAVYVLGETVHITGQVEYPFDFNNLVVMTIFTPSGQRLLIDEFELGTDGRFTWSFTLPETGAGQWVVNSKFSTKQAEATISVLETDLFDKIFVANPATFDVQGNSITEGRVGESMAIAATLVNDEQVSQSFMFIVQVVDEEGSASSFLLTLGSLQPGESKDYSVSWLPKEQGTYTAEIFVWTSLSDPTPLVEKQAVALSVA